jgi:hypothetical protein
MNGKLIKLSQFVLIEGSLRRFKMSRKNLFEILIGLALLVLLVLAVQLGASTQTAAAENEAILAARQAGSDWIERHPVLASPARYAGSDWVERNPSRFYTGSDFFERHRPAAASPASYAGSDFFERHRPAAASPANYTGSDWIERNPSRFYTGSDYYERHPAQPTR